MATAHVFILISITLIKIIQTSRKKFDWLFIGHFFTLYFFQIKVKLQVEHKRCWAFKSGGRAGSAVFVGGAYPS